MTLPTGELLGEVLALVAAVFGATSVVLFRRAFSYDEIEPETGVTPYLVLLTAVFLPYVIASGLPTSPAVLAPFVVGGLIGFVGGSIAYFRSIRWIGAARAVPIRSSAPVFAPAFGSLFLGQPMTVALVIGTLTVVLGSVLIVYETRGASKVALEARTLSLGIGSAVLSAALFALYPVVLRLGYDAGGTPYQAVAIAGVSALIVIAVAGQFNDAIDPRPVTGPGKRYLFGGAIALALAITIYLIAFSLAPVVIVIVIYGSLPLFSAVLSYLFLGDLETVTAPVAIGSVLVVVGVFFAIAG